MAYIQDLMKLTAAGTALELHEVPFLIPQNVVTKAGAKELIFKGFSKESGVRSFHRILTKKEVMLKLEEVKGFKEEFFVWLTKL